MLGERVDVSHLAFDHAFQNSRGRVSGSGRREIYLISKAIDRKTVLELPGLPKAEFDISTYISGVVHPPSAKDGTPGASGAR